jgi:hypothetical protein
MALKNIASGTIQITNIKDRKVQLKEIIHIAILLKSNSSKYKVKQWSDELIHHKPLTTQYEEFS